MEPDFSSAVIEATVMIEQQLGENRKAIGTGFLIGDTAPDGRPRVVLVTAGHVFTEMSRAQTRIGYRVKVNQEWTYSPSTLDIRAQDGRPLWTAHTARDVAVIEVRVPPEIAAKAIPLAYLADEDSFDRERIEPGEEFMALGYPRGLSSNAAGFPILRTGRLASYPLGRAADSPTFLLDFSVFPGNSGGPVLLSSSGSGGTARTGFIAGMLTQQVEVEHERMDIGIVTHARFVREALRLMDGQLPPDIRRAAVPDHPAGVTVVARERIRH